MSQWTATWIAIWQLFRYESLNLHLICWTLLILKSKNANVSPELFRISSFARFPASGVTERSLARAGWFYTGVGDRVQCFRCNVTAEGWQPGDCPTEKHRQLSPSCSFIQSLPPTANLLSSSHSAFSPLRIVPTLPVRASITYLLYRTCLQHFWSIVSTMHQSTMNNRISIFGYRISKLNVKQIHKARAIMCLNVGCHTICTDDIFFKMEIQLVLKLVKINEMACIFFNPAFWARSSLSKPIRKPSWRASGLFEYGLFSSTAF